ncbi:hypothetical protein ASC61_10040 [Aeromicrobium sp. Root344]|uniref:DUF4012 domain-containing protein n=1 Tax=Aeromicrobium sp. Root344 TaxID=1736521 RepID=UPI0006F4CDEA|nr:DUF4012 domain-containing protein [Aeromicrobium sp. Root344]KQV75313.1 hypothetical protein ASC61_10040 [Aeromicrobium sp. Root344]
MSSTQRRRGHKPWYRQITRDRVFMALLGLVVLLLLLFAFQALRANSSLRLAASQSELLQNQIVAGDDTAAKATLSSLQESTSRARSTTDGPLWDLGAHVPFFGRNIDAVQTVSRVMDDVSTQALPPVVALSKEINLNTYSPHDGKVDLAAINKIAPSVNTVTDALTAAQKELSDIDAQSLLVPLRGPVSTIQFKVDSAKAAADSSNLAAKLLPEMLGQQETRRYLLLIQNNAEIRSTGGISGSYAILKAKKGKLSMGFQGSIQDLKQFSEPVLPMTKNEATVFSPTLVTNLLDANMTPDFPRTAEIAKAMVAKGLDTKVDGVISVDPVAMSYILAGTGPIRIPNGPAFDQNNAVDLLLNKTYVLLKDRDQQDAVFKVAARAIFDAVKAGRSDSRLVIDGLVKAASENRLMVWSSHKSEQTLIEPSGVSGELSGNGGKVPHVGLYFGDAASTKMEYYLDYNTSMSVGRCLRDDVQEINTTTELTSNAPANAADLPKAVTGNGLYTPRGTMRLLLRFYSPYAGGFTDVRVNGVKQTVYADTHRGRNVTKVLLTVKPQQSYTIRTSMISGPHQPGDPVFSTTPGVHSMQNDVSIKSACS